MIEIISHNVLEGLLHRIRKSYLYSVICDGSRDCSGLAQEVLCVRWVNSELEPEETLLGLYDMSHDTSGLSIANMIFDVLCRCQLSIEQLRGQTFDRAANMSGKYKGAQAIIAERQPLAPFVHCISHCINLVVLRIIESHRITRDAVSLVNEVGTFASNSPKLKARISLNYNIPTLSPICPTRWLVRGKTVSNVYDHLLEVITILDDIANDCSISAEQSAKASGLSKRLQCCDFVMGARLTFYLCSQLENLNIKSQTIASNVPEIVAATKVVLDDIT